MAHDTGDAPSYTHGHHESVLRSHRNRTVHNSAAYLLPHLTGGQDVLDVGSGPGTITADLANLVAPGRVTAVEMHEEAAALTRSGLADAGAEADVLVADALHLPFADAEFDVSHAHQVLQHVSDPVQVLREMGRVTRPDGLVAVRDADYAGFLWHPVVPELDEWLGLYRRAARHNGGEPDAGRHLYAWTRAAGLEPVEVTTSTWTYWTAEERHWWGGMWADRIQGSALARQLTDLGWASPADLRRISAGWRRWSDDADGWFMIPHAQVLARPAAD
ncbi:methyltransferase domain-containing protein [Leekyejoonella antrihumi]|uniref:Methyltransferase domain-containing protein n=1 Tax=Leekyejoonella antrihumi TaxID=1660198 RepID=A0A563DZJ6_9MICO|nr:methyltransferase domain-containing protein [Leekyejoonella antrihumi]TWP35680.1 methyltransferase domain-containing protein [Leekyejoonella antrihumi]